MPRAVQASGSAVASSLLNLQPDLTTIRPSLTRKNRHHLKAVVKGAPSASFQKANVPGSFRITVILII